MSDDIYREEGYRDREDYLECLADEYDVPLDVVLAAAEVLGPSEDFDGLISALEDASQMTW